MTLRLLLSIICIAPGLFITGCGQNSTPVSSEQHQESGWKALGNNSVSGLHTVWFADSMNGWLGGDGGLILHTTDGGHGWMAQTSGTRDDIRSLFFLDSSRGWAVGWNKRILATIDGGEHWVLQFDEPRFGGTLEKVWCTSNGNGWAVGRFPLVHTTDGGRHWEYTADPDLAVYDLQGVAFADDQHGWLVGSKQVMHENGINFDFVGVILRTTDAGRTWDTTSGWGTLNDISTIDATTAWAVGTEGTIVQTTDGGATWHQQQSGTSASLNSIQFIDRKHGWAVGGEGQNIVLHTSNGGQTWQEQYTGVYSEFNTVFFLDALTGWIAAENATLLHTTSGGNLPDHP